MKKGLTVFIFFLTFTLVDGTTALPRPSKNDNPGPIFGIRSSNIHADGQLVGYLNRTARRLHAPGIPSCTPEKIITSSTTFIITYSV
jgi:hypothetical protein